MTKLKAMITKAWIFVVAAVLIVGSSTAMAFTLDRNVPESASANEIWITPDAKEGIQSLSAENDNTIEYSVIDLSKTAHERRALIEEKLSKIEGITPEQIEEKCNTIIYNLTPGEKDISAQQAAAYAADILKKAYKVDFNGYTAEASFARSAVPNSDSWTVAFYSPEAVRNNEQSWIGKTYIAAVNSVNCTMLYASFCNREYTQINEDLENPEWLEKSVQAISALLPENVSISSSKVVSALPETGVTVVCELSNGSAYSVRLTGEKKEAADYMFFPHGYDGSLDYSNTAKEKAVG